MTEQSASFLVDDVAAHFKLKSYRQMSALVDLFAQSVGRKITSGMMVRLAAQLVGNRKNLEGGVPLTRFEGVKEAQWVPFLIQDLKPCLFASKAGMELCLRCIAGSYSGHFASKKCPVRFLARIAYSIGYTVRRRYDEPKDLEGLMFAGYILPSPSSELDFQHYDVTSYMRGYNKDIIKQRKGNDEDD